MISAAQQNGRKSGRVSKTLKIQPKVISAPQQQVISIVSPASATKLTLPKIGTFFFLYLLTQIEKNFFVLFKSHVYF